MKTAFITAEYNPFHNGHIYHISETKKLTGSENIVVVMSGNFVQRGAPAIVDKWQRTRCALLNGADMVIELPFLFACSSAEYFAAAAVQTAVKSKMADFISFGCENNDCGVIEASAKLLAREDQAFKNELSSMLENGTSFPLARQRALENSGLNQKLLSNDILAVEYVKELIKSGSKIVAVPVLRKGESYNSDTLNGSLISATAIRKAVLNADIENILNGVPFDTAQMLKNAKAENTLFTENMFSAYLDFSVRSGKKIEEILDIREGIENCIYKAVQNCNTFSEICSFVKSKRYTYTSVSRMLMHILFSIKKQDMDRFKKINYIPYFRVLGFRREKEYLVKKLILSGLPVLVNIKKDENKLDENGHFLFDIEKRTTDIYFGACKNSDFRKLNCEYTVPPVII